MNLVSGIVSIVALVFIYTLADRWIIIYGMGVATKAVEVQLEATSCIQKNLDSFGLGKQFMPQAGNGGGM